MRSTIKPTKTIFAREDGEMIERPTAARMIEGLPASIPGQQLLVDPAKGTYTLTVPIRDDEELCEKIRRAMSQQGIHTDNKIKGVPKKTGTLDADAMKSLCREMLWLVDAGEAIVCDGVVPSMEDIEDLEGEFLTNACSMGDWKQPRYERDLPAWVETLNRLR